MAEKLTKAQIIEALRDVYDNGGYMTIPGTASRITALWGALKDAGYVRLNIRRGFQITSIGRAALSLSEGGK